MRTIGVLGGMGPAATADFLARLVTEAAARTDQEHPPVLVYSASHIPDRTIHLTGGGPDPTPGLQLAARVLERAGADLIAIPCNTAHAYHPAIVEAVTIPVLDMIALTVEQVASRYERGAAIGILAATGTIHLGLYARRLEAAGFVPRLPADQDAVMESIRAVKGGRRGADARLAAAVADLIERGARALILGCTELPLALRPEDTPVPLLDAGGILARTCLRRAGATLRDG